MNDLTLGLRIRVNDDGSVQVLNRVGDGIDNVASSARRANDPVSTLTTGIGLLHKAMAAGSVAVLANELLDVNKEFQSLRASLSTTVGGLENAGTAFQFVQDFAAKTPYDVAQVTESFIKLGNLGLKPSEEALRSYGNTAAAQSKPIMQMIEAVADATTGEFERLKEFGIKASQEKDKVTFTFQGVSTTVKNSASDIERYLIDLGNNKFGDAMAGQAKIINGAVSNLDDTWDAFMDNLLDDTKENLIAKWIADAAAAIKWLDIGINGAVRSADKLAVIDQRIAANRASLAAHKSNGMFGSMIDDFAGYDEGLKQNQIDMDIKAREALIKEIEKQKTAQDELISSIGKSDAAKASSADTDKKAASEAKNLAAAYNNATNSIAQGLATMGNHTKAAAMEYEVMTGSLKDLTEAKKLYLLQLAAEFDNRTLERNANNAAKAALDSLIDKYNQLTLSARAYYETTLKTKDGVPLSPEQKAPIMQQYNENTVLEANKQLIDDATASVNKYASSIDSAKNNMADLGGVTSSVFDGALGGVSLLSGAIDNMVTALEKNSAALDQLGMDRLDNDEKQRAGLKALADMRVKGQISESEAIIARGKINVKWSENELGLTKSEIALSKEKTVTELSGARQIAGAAARMFDEKSSAAKALHNVEMGIAVAQMTMQGVQMVKDVAATGVSMAAGAAKFFAQSGWAGFAGVAAMGAVMAGLGYAAFSGVGGGDSMPPEYSKDTGTVLGDPTAKSESIDKTYQLLKDIHADEYAELRGINQGIASLKGGITDVITRLYQAGGLSAVGVLPTTKSLAINPMMFNVLAGGWIGLLAEGLKKLPVIGGFLSGIEDFVLGGLFGKKTVSQQVTGQGIQTNPTSILDIINGGNLSASQFADIATTVKKKSWFSSSSSTTYSTQYAALDAATQEALNKVFGSMGHTMLSLADSIGHDTKRSVENYIIPAMKVDLKGLSGEDAAKRLNGVISAELDNMATTVFGDIIGQYQQLGEGMLETAVRIVAEVAVVEDALSKSGLSISGDAIAISDGLAQAAGGLQEFQKQFDNYYQKFYTDAERHAFTQRQLNSQLSDVNVLLPATRDGYRKIIEALDINNAADQQRYSMLLKLSDAADSYYQTIESQAEDAQRIAQQRRALDIEYMTLSSRALGALIERRKDELAALDPSLRFKQQAVWAASEANKAIDDAMATLKKSVADQKALNASAHQAKIDALTIERQTALEGMTIQKQAATDLLNSLKTVAANIKTALGSTVIDSQAYMRKRREDAQDVLSAALLSAQAGGSLADFKGLDQALADIAKPSEQLHATFVDYAIDQARTGAVISSLDEHATAQISVADQTLAAIEANTKQVSASIEASTKELRATLEADNAALDALITTAQAQIDAARGTTAEVMSVKDAVDNLARALEVRSQTLKAIESANAATAFADAAKKIADDANSKAQSSADALAAQIALSERATKAAADAQRDATAKATWQPAPNTWIAGQSGNPLWEKVLAAFNAEHTAKYGIAMNRPWSSDAPSQHQYRYLVGEYNSLASAAASAAQASASALAATADAIKTAIPDYQAAADTDARAASTANADAAAKAAAAGAAQSAAVEFEYTSQGGAAINKIADKFYNAFNGLTVSASTKKDNFEALRRASGFGAVYELATKQGLDSRGLDLLMDWSAGTSAQKAENWKLPAFDVGINNVPFDMAAIVHQGERIFPAADNRELMMRLSEPRQSGVQVDALVAEVQELRRVAAELQVALNKIEKNTGGTESSSKRMADQLRSMTPDGQSLRVTTA